MKGSGYGTTSEAIPATGSFHSGGQQPFYAGEKAKAATDGIREMVTEAQTKGPPGLERSYFWFSLIRFSDTAENYPGCDMTPVRHIDPLTLNIPGDSGQTNITAALQLTLDRLKPYMGARGIRSN